MSASAFSLLAVALGSAKLKRTCYDWLGGAELWGLDQALVEVEG